jgi:hypothetical protein
VPDAKNTQILHPAEPKVPCFLRATAEPARSWRRPDPRGRRN